MYHLGKGIVYIHLLWIKNTLQIHDCVNTLFSNFVINFEIHHDSNRMKRVFYQYSVQKCVLFYKSQTYRIKQNIVQRSFLKLIVTKGRYILSSMTTISYFNIFNSQMNEIQRVHTVEDFSLC